MIAEKKAQVKNKEVKFHTVSPLFKKSFAISIPAFKINITSDHVSITHPKKMISGQFISEPMW